jgi:hypothetical protein
MSAVKIPAICAALIPLLAGCDMLKSNRAETKPEQTPAGGGQALIGMVEQVNPEQRYVLIRCEQVLGLPAGTELTALDASGAKSRLVLTPERKGYYLTADIKEGSPQVNNLVMYRSASSAAAASQPQPAIAPIPPTAATTPGGTEPALPMVAPALPPPAGGTLPLEPPASPPPP